MKDKLHEHIMNELKANEKSNTTFVLAALVINSITLAVNAAVSDDSDLLNVIVMVLFILLSASFTFITINALAKGQHIRSSLIKGLSDLYKDEGVDRYYGGNLLTDYNKRYTLLKLVILILGVIAVIIPLLIMFVD